jgi:hypothetical protein
MVREPEFRATKSPAMVRKVTRYSQLYVERGRPQADSQRARIRLHALLASLLNADHLAKVQEAITLELGI